MLKLGIIGMSEGNGHPYSWSAIFNGYDPKYMASCPFPVIPEYLRKQCFPEDTIDNATVSHIWCQDHATAKHIAQACHIEHIVNTLEEMVEQVDAVLLARDDAENHYRMSRPFLEAGKPIYIDKPLAYSSQEAQQIYQLRRTPGAIFSCSAFSFSPEINQLLTEIDFLQQLQCIQASIPKSWDKYAIHLIEPIVKLILQAHGTLTVAAPHFIQHGELASLSCLINEKIHTNLITLGPNNRSIPSIRLQSQSGQRLIEFTSTYASFKNALQYFVDSLEVKELGEMREEEQREGENQKEGVDQRQKLGQCLDQNSANQQMPSDSHEAIMLKAIDVLSIPLSL